MNLLKRAQQNNHYRKVVQTVGDDFQLVLMALDPGEDIPPETHKHITQFIYVVEGLGQAVVARKKHKLKKGTALTIPKNQTHYLKNTSPRQKLKLFTIYTPPEHGPSKAQKRQPR